MAIKLASGLDHLSAGKKKNEPITDSTPPLTNAIPPTTNPVEEDLVIKTASAVTPNDTEVTPPDKKVEAPSFEEYYKNYIDGLKTKAEAQREKDIINAQNTYSKALSTYGSNAAALSSNGLAQSGYSKYLDRQAAAQRQADINAAYAAETATKDNAQSMYMDYLKGVEDKRTSTYNSLYNSLDSLSVNDIETLGKQNGLTDTQIASLQAAKKNLTYKKLSQSSYTVEELEAEKDNLTPEQYEKLTETVYEPTDDIQTTSFAGLTYAEANDQLQEILDNPAISQTIKDQWRSSFNEAFKVYTKDGVVFNQDGGSERPGKKGNNISVKGQQYGDGIWRVQYNGVKVENGGATVDGISADEAKDIVMISDTLPVNTVFMYKGQVYLKYSNGNIYGLSARDNSYKGDLQEIIDQFNIEADKQAQASK